MVIAAPCAVGLDAARLSELGTFLRQWPEHNVQLSSSWRGKLVFERYFRGRERRWDGVV